MRWRFFFYLAIIFVISLFNKCARCFSSSQILSSRTRIQRRRRPRSRTNFCQASKLLDLQFADVNLTPNVNQVLLISLLRVYALDVIGCRGKQTFWLFWSAYAITSSKFAGDKICRHFWQSQINLLNLVSTEPNLTYIWYLAESNPGHIMGGGRSHHCAIPVPQSPTLVYYPMLFTSVLRIHIVCAVREERTRAGKDFFINRVIRYNRSYVKCSVL